MIRRFGQRIFAAGVLTVMVVCAGADAAEQAATRQIVFVCEHGSVKSLMAASYFNQLAAQRGLPWRAVSRGAAPDSTTVPQPIAAALRADGVDVGDFRPVKVEAAEAADAERIVTIGTELPAGVRADEQRLERWNDVPPASTGYDAARSSLKAHISELLERLSRQSAEGQPDRRH
jgi:arsenate reductase (thioredoxin)